MIQLPINSLWKTALDSDLFQSISGAKNMNFDMPGYAALARKSMCLYNQDQRVDLSFNVPQVIISDDTTGYIVTTVGVFSMDMESETYAVDRVPVGGATPNLFAGTDALYYQSLPHISGTQTVATYDGAFWTAVITGLSNSYPHPLCVMENRQTLLVGNGNVLQQYSAAYVLDSTNTLTLPPEYIIEWIRYRQSTAIIGTRNINGGEAKMFLWNGVGVGFQTAYGIGADWAYSGCEYQSSIVIIASSGRLLRFNGGGFDELAALPVYSTPYPWTSNASRTNLIGKVASRGMAAHGDTLYINIDGTLDVGNGETPGTYLNSQPGGLWVYDPSVGIYPKAGYTYDIKQKLVPTEIDSGYLVFSTPHQALTGDPVLYSGVGAFTNLNLGQTYYAIADSGATTALKLALSPADALAGRSITLSGTPTTDQFTFDTYSSLGSSLSMRSGPVFVLGQPHVNTFYGSEVLFAGSTMDESGDEKFVLCSLGAGRNRGSFTTPKIASSQVKDAFNKLVAKMGELHLDTDQIVIKYRDSERFGLPTQKSFATGAFTWNSSTTFTVDPTKVAFGTVEVGDEITVISGAGAGYTAHILSIVGNVYTIDETLPISNGQVCEIVADNWTKLNTFTSQSKNNVDNFAEVGVMHVATQAQFKVELRGKDTSIMQMQLINTAQKQSK